MTLINVKCIDQKLYLANMPTVASGGINETKIKFDFCPLWDGFGKVAIFYCNEEAVYNVVIDNNNECVVPYEVLISSGKFYFGVFATNEDEIRRTSDILAYKVVKGAFIEGQKPTEPTPDIYEQILALYAKSMQDNETFYNNVLAANEELFNSFQEENEALYNNFVEANEKLVGDVVEANIDYKEELEATQAQIKSYYDELNYYAPFIKVESSTPSAYNLEFDKTYIIKIDFDDEVTNYDLTFNLTYDTNAVDDNKYATRSITIPLEKDQLGKQVKFRVFSWFNEYGQMLYFHYEQTLAGRKGIEYSDSTYGIKGNVKISSLRLVRLDGTAFDLYVENEYGDGGSKGIVRANEELNGTEESLTSLTVNDTKYKFPSSIEHVTLSSFNISDIMHEMLSKYAVESKDCAYFVGNESNKGQYYVYLDYAYSRVNFMVHVFNITGNTVYKSKVVDITNLPETIEYTIEYRKVEANPYLDGTEQTLTSLSINNNKYKIDGGIPYISLPIDDCNYHDPNELAKYMLTNYNEGIYNINYELIVTLKRIYSDVFAILIYDITSGLQYKSLSTHSKSEIPETIEMEKVNGTDNKVNYKEITADMALVTDVYNELIDEFDSTYCIANLQGSLSTQGYLYISHHGSTIYTVTFFDFFNQSYYSNTNDMNGVNLKTALADGKKLTSVKANVELAGTEQALTSLSIDGNRYKVSDGESGNVDLSNYYQKEEIDSSLTLKADLVNGLIPAAQLPSYVDDVIEFNKEVSGKSWLETTLATEIGSIVWNNTAASNLSGGSSSPYYKKFFKNIDGTEAGLEIFPPEAGKIYVNIGSDGYKTYRWSGSNLVEISKSIGLGESSTTAYAGNKGKANATKIAELETIINNGRSIPNYQSQEFTVIDSGLEYKSGYNCIKQIGEMLWILISGVYNFTDSYEQKNVHKVLQFTLPKDISVKLLTTNGSATDKGTICYFPALTYENVTYTTFNCQSYLSRSEIGDSYDTYTITFTGLSELTKDGGLTGFHLRMPLLLI